MCSVANSLNWISQSDQFIKLEPRAGLLIDLKYASIDNFMGENLYGDFKSAYLHKVAAEKLELALTALAESHPGYGLLIYDALRPRSIQRLLWERVVGTPNQQYIGNPDRGSMHNFGFAVDLTIVDEKHVPLDMGAGFDDFRPISHPALEEQHLKTGELTSMQLKNRKWLRSIMSKSGFSPISHEWWHFEAMDRVEVRHLYQIVE